METTAALPNIFESSRRNNRRGPDRKTWQGSTGKAPPHDPGGGIDRRTFLALGAATLAATIFGINKARQASQPPEGTPLPTPDPYKGWERYTNRALPKDTVLAIGKDLAVDTEYPGFSEVGQFLVTATTNPGEVNKIIAPFITNDPHEIVLPEGLLRQRGVLAGLEGNMHGVGLAATLKRKGDDQPGKTVLVGITDPTRMQVLLDSTFYAAPDIAKKLLIVKELSHQLLIAEHKKLMASEVLQNFDIELDDPSLNMEDVLWASSQYKASGTNIPSLGDLFDNGNLDIDGAGYYYIMRAYGKMKSQGLFDSHALNVLQSDDEAYEAARRRGLLIEQGKGNFVWKEGIGPFSPEWRAIGRAVLKGEYQKLR